MSGPQLYPESDMGRVLTLPDLAAFDALPCPMWLTDTGPWIQLWANTFTLSLYGVTSSQALNDLVADASEQTRDLDRTTLHEIQRTRRPVVRQDAVYPGGVATPAQVHYTAVMFDPEDGSQPRSVLLATACLQQPVATDQQWAALGLKSTDTRLWVYSSDARMLWSSPASRVLAETDAWQRRRRAAGSNPLSVHLPDSPDVVTLLTTLCNDNRQPFGQRLLQEDIRHADGAEWVTLTVTKVRSIEAAGSDSVLAVAETPITDLKRAMERMESVSRAKAMKDTFVAALSHELRTPLNSIMGMLQILLDSNLSRQHTSLVETAMFSSSALLNTLTDVLDLRRVATGQLEVVPKPTKLSTVVALFEEISSLFVTQVAANNVELRIDTPLSYSDSPSPRVMCDLARVRQVVLNLMSNAVKYTTEGRIVVSFWIDTTPPPSTGTMIEADTVHERTPKARTSDAVITMERGLSGAESSLPKPAPAAAAVLSTPCYFHAEVRDSGVGIEPSKLELIFQEFYRDQTDSTGWVSGSSGLGLSITRHVVRLLRGRLNVKSEPGVGSRFSMTFPTTCDTAALLGSPDSVSRASSTGTPDAALLRNSGYSTPPSGHGAGAGAGGTAPSPVATSRITPATSGAP